MKTIPTPPVIDTSDEGTYHVQAYPLRFTLSTALMLVADEWDALPWWRRILARWASKRDWGTACRGWSKLVVTEDDLTQCVMVDREELISTFGGDR